ncbi:DUF1961 family protein [Roseivirga sp. E12]|uniref:DUF1961 family protein n=1 Tax=Roseivirga sp. E12 TaxID=2819237 RepID=UPI001ABC1787|nr:DUF1961 family protein [Roseivirga sp. E12]MBO3697164.1 DUF1961 family protein [Roseivirga sp. E12]
MMPIFSIILFSLFHFGYAQNQQTKTPVREAFSVQELANWQTYGIGKASVSNGELILEETAGSDGLFLVSPKSYDGAITINYKVKAMSESSVQIVLFSASDAGESMALTLPSSNDLTPREVWTWRTTLEHYNLTFNNRSHGIKPFFFKNISPYEKGFRLDQKENVMETQRWYNVEIIKGDSTIKFTLDDKVIFEVKDHEPLAGGHIMLRISGTTGDKVIFAKAAYKDFVLTHG